MAKELCCSTRFVEVHHPTEVIMLVLKCSSEKSIDEEFQASLVPKVDKELAKCLEQKGTLP
ncbi:hypothetical protein Csa_001891 [Cucumis sativus]|uniref:Uncharacterized protein n=1 Tax=Cucumis sativus TaxID=3659 RepID=A0A0A0LGD3_CUCSA|nr:hypothetical protein Csa_001891 [Cucumis sativus]